MTPAGSSSLESSLGFCPAQLSTSIVSSYSRGLQSARDRARLRDAAEDRSATFGGSYHRRSCAARGGLRRPASRTPLDAALSAPLRPGETTAWTRSSVPGFCRELSYDVRTRARRDRGRSTAQDPVEVTAGRDRTKAAPRRFERVLKCCQ
ncbi:hypothetical protein SKAU_G00188460 [Synaphobranchus kaupii]|uniref:Uncharacterized protein n=1 Tax=Synaphobranchus kaupii TaxID=118154 RepID=A0A9Q1FD54_SYNKA|nr:hypothetical protein SKAU_G00188460 [Synaphobranchus kaupii]